MNPTDDDRDILAPLNPAQLEAASHIDGPLLVLAGAGSGKTRVITHRIAWMIHQGIEPARILAVTFTNKAAREMRSRVLDLTGQADVQLATFHGFSAAFLRQEFPAVGRASEFTIYDDGDSKTLVRQAMADLGFDTESLDPAVVRSAIGAWKNDLVTPADLDAGGLGRRDEQAAQVYERYEQLLVEANACDFDDLLVRTLDILRSHEEVLERWRERLTHVLVDEFQDTNHVQFELVHALCRESRNLCVTGDPDQSIYSWRGADPGNFDRFQDDYPEARVVPLERNYRSTGNILQCASQLIACNRHRLPKTLWTEEGPGEPVRVLELRDDLEEARQIARFTREWQEEGFSPGEIAVFYRTNALSAPVERMLLQEDVPYQVVGGLEFFARQEVKDVVAWLRFLVNPRDLVSAMRIINVPPRGIGARTRELALQLASRTGRPLGDVLRDRTCSDEFPGRAKKALEGLARMLHELDDCLAAEDIGAHTALQSVLDVTGYADWWKLKATKGGSLDPFQNIGQLVNMASDYDRLEAGSLARFVADIALMTDTDRWEEDQERISLLTLHSSKGLEFDAVIIIGVERNLLPHVVAASSPDGLEEERRLLHVGMTRARRRLVLTCAGSRTRFGRTAACSPSAFLEELGSEGVVLERSSAGGTHAGPEEDHPLADLRPGTTVRHAQWGLGVVSRLRGRGQGLDRKADIVFDGGHVRTVVLRHAELEIMEDYEIDGF